MLPLLRQTAKARDLQAECARHGLPIDLASAVASVMDEDNGTAPDAAMTPADLDMVDRLGLDRETYQPTKTPAAPDENLLPENAKPRVPLHLFAAAQRAPFAAPRMPPLVHVGCKQLSSRALPPYPKPQPLLLTEAKTLCRSSFATTTWIRRSGR